MNPRAPAPLDARGREAWVAALADLLETETDALRALRLLEALGPSSAGMARRVAGAVQSGRHLAAALLESGCLFAAEAEALRGLESADVRAAGLRLIVSRRRRRWARLRAAAGAALNPLALTLVTLLGLQAPLLVLDVVSLGSAMRPVTVFIGGLVALGVVIGLAVTRGSPGLWARIAAVPGLRGWFERQAEVEVAHALAELAHDDAPTAAAWTTAAAFVPLPRHRASLRTLAEHAQGGRSTPPVEPWHPALGLTVVGGAAGGRLRTRCRALAETGDAALTGRLVLVVRLLAYTTLIVASSMAVASLLDSDIKLPGMPDINLTNPYGDLEKMLEQELK